MTMQFSVRSRCSAVHSPPARPDLPRAGGREPGPDKGIQSGDWQFEIFVKLVIDLNESVELG